MIRRDLKTVRVENKHVQTGVLINAHEFNPDLHKLVETQQANARSVKKPKPESE